MALWINYGCIQTEDIWCCTLQFQRLIIYFDILSSLNKIHHRNISHRHLAVVYIGVPFQNLSNQKWIKRQNNGKTEDWAAENNLLDKAHFHFSNNKPKLKLYMYMWLLLPSYFVFLEFRELCLMQVNIRCFSHVRLFDYAFGFSGRTEHLCAIFRQHSEPHQTIYNQITPLLTCSPNDNNWRKFLVWYLTVCVVMMLLKEVHFLVITSLKPRLGRTHFECGVFF